MKNLFEAKVQREIADRICLLKKDITPGWGKMNCGQMLAHCNAVFKTPLSGQQPPRLFAGRLLGWAMKSKMYDDKLWPKGMPTARELRITDDPDFEEERRRLIKQVDQFFMTDPEAISKFIHPMFGKLTGEQWGKMMYKHLDHHLRQFGV